ncbi:hypothetical protein HYV49_00135 [Candidatus Pacearchaeota archaeon]|nr:hypothetical protein [Candidatus Pacearchaeota archaeon]
MLNKSPLHRASQLKMLNKRGTIDIGGGLVWIVVLIIVFFAMMIFFIVVIFTPKSYSADIYKETQDNGIIQHEMLNALMKSEFDGKLFEEQLRMYFRGEDIDIDLGQKIEDILKKRGDGCYLFSVNVPTSSLFDRYVLERFRIEGSSLSKSGFVQTLSFDKRAISFDIEGKEGRFYFGRC